MHVAKIKTCRQKQQMCMPLGTKLVLVNLKRVLLTESGLDLLPHPIGQSDDSVSNLTVQLEMPLSGCFWKNHWSRNRCHAPRPPLIFFRPNSMLWPLYAFVELSLCRCVAPQPRWLSTQPFRCKSRYATTVRRSKRSATCNLVKIWLDGLSSAAVQRRMQTNFAAIRIEGFTCLIACWPRKRAVHVSVRKWEAAKEVKSWSFHIYSTCTLFQN